MGKKLIIDTSEGEHTEIDYSALSLKEINERIRSYEKKYSMTFARYNKQYDCGDAAPQEVTDYMDWENLIEERKTRKEKEVAYDRG